LIETDLSKAERGTVLGAELTPGAVAIESLRHHPMGRP
jgi:hypothetical protein